MSYARRIPCRSGAGASALALFLLVLAGCVGPAQRPPPRPAETRSAPANVEAGADTVPRAEPHSAHGNPPFYDALGRRYFVLAAADGYLERGVASWYGPTFHGVSTSSGEPYDMYGMSAAHKTLPLPSYVRVTNLKNGRSVVVRVNDRGPFVANRLIDLSYSAAARLDMIREGTTLVEVRALIPGVPEHAKRSAQGPPTLLFVQAGAFADARNAERLLARLQAAGLVSAFVAAPAEGKLPLYRVRLGPVASVGQFDELSARLAALGIADARLAID